jgi:hypothetical protein
MMEANTNRVHTIAGMQLDTANFPSFIDLIINRNLSPPSGGRITQQYADVKHH